MPCSTENMVTLFFNVPSSFHLLILFFYFSSIFLAKFFCSLCHKTIPKSTSDGCEAGSPEEEEEEEEDLGFFTVTCMEEEDLVTGIIHLGEALLPMPTKIPEKDQVLIEEGIGVEEPIFEDTMSASESCHSMEIVTEEEPPAKDSEPITAPNENGPLASDTASDEERDTENGNVEANISENRNFLILETKKFQAQENRGEDIFGDSLTEGSTSKSSSDWRNYTNRDSGTEDPFSSSSRRSCPTWESYTVFPKYDEEMIFFDRISAQKLNETESLRAVEVCPKSISQKIVHKLTTRNKSSSSALRRNRPYQELEMAYVAQICLAWEALNWNYKSFQQFRASRREEDPGCSGQISQQFQLFQVLLQRFIENEPYEHGRRPEVYARMRIATPKLLQVPEFRDSENDHKAELSNTKISSVKFLMIMEDAIRTFMKFLKADREKHCQQIFKAFFRRNNRSSVDPTLLDLIKKTNKKKKMKLKDLRGARKCLRKRRLKEEEEIEILMSQIDLKVVSRVLRMSEISEEQLHWCEEKMSKVRVGEGKLQRDSSPLFLPAH